MKGSPKERRTQDNESRFLFRNNCRLPGPQCNKPLGMQNGRLRASQITASSSWDKNHAANNGRLHLKRAGSRMGAWCARHNNRYQWLSVDFGRPMRITKVASQGRQDARQWVTQYYLSYSQDSVFFAEYKQNSARRVRTWILAQLQQSGKSVKRC